MKRQLLAVMLLSACATTPASSGPLTPGAPEPSAAPAQPPEPTCPKALPSLAEQAPPFGAKVEKVCLVGASDDSYLRLHELVAPREGEALSAELAQEDLKGLYALGFVRDVVAVAELLPSKGVMLSYFVTEHERVAEVRVAGVHAVDGELLKALLPLGLPASLALRKALEDKTTEFYAELGYAHAKVKVTMSSQGPGKAVLSLDVEEGPRVTLQALTFAGVKQAKEAELKKVLRSRVGEPFSEKELLRDAAAVTAAYYDRGMIQVKVEPTHSEADGAVTAVFTVEEGPVFRVGKLSLTGVSLGAPADVLEKLETKPKAVFSRARIQHDVERVREIARQQGLLVEVTPLTEVNADREVIDLTFEVERTKGGPLKF
ncbi:MAG: hypothetical protein AMXMBFR34_24890 [Myxococcaceae bacterium]